MIGFTDAFLNAVLDPNLNANEILDAYAKQCPSDAAGFPIRQIEAFFIDNWLKALRAQSRDNATKYDLPFHSPEIGVPANIPTGPSRTRVSQRRAQCVGLSGRRQPCLLEGAIGRDAKR